MLFPTVTFAVFFLVVYVANWLTMPRPRLWRWTILLASVVFYGWWDWRFVLLLAAAALATSSSPCACAAAPRRAGGGDAADGRGRARPRAAGCVVAVAANLGVLGVFKYYDFFVTSLDGLLGAFGLGSSLPLLDLVLPVGLSFLMFRMLTLRRRRLAGPDRAGAGAGLRRLRGLLPLPARRAHRAGRRVPAAAARAARPAQRRRGARLPADRRRPRQEGADRRLPRHAPRQRAVRGARSSTRAGRRSSASTPTRRRSTATSAATPTSPSASRCSSGSRCRRTSTRPTRRAR